MALETTNEKPTEFGISVRLKGKGTLQDATKVKPEPQVVYQEVIKEVWPEPSWSNWLLFTKQVLIATGRRLKNGIARWFE